MYSLPLILWLAISNCGFSSTESNSLNGQHLRVIWPLWSGNPKGLLGPLKGGVALDFLSARLNFTYEMVRVTENRLFPLGKERGLFNYLWDQQCDLLLQDASPSFYRNGFDLSTPWIFAYYALLIPADDEIAANINAVVKPFQWPVWLGLGVSVVCVMAVLILILRLFPHLPTKLDSDEKVQISKNNSGSQNRNGLLSVAKEPPGKQYLYVFGVLLSQGGPCSSKRLPIRLVAGVWCLAAFIFVQAYSSILFTYIVTPVNLPLVNSIDDVLENNDIQMLVRKDSPLNEYFMKTDVTGMYLKFRNKVNSFPNSRCNLTSDCVSIITPGLRNVLMEAENYLKDIIKLDFNKARKCNFKIATKRFMPRQISFGLQQNSPYTKSINLGIFELQQTGLINFWDSWFRPMPPQCNGDAPSKTPRNKLSSLSMKNLTGAFLLLVVGLSLSLLAFFVEQIHFMLSA